jgi:aspartate-semialdehyde dehydrogenase
MKMVNETRKIFGEPNLLISATTVRVPTLIGHGEAINAEFAGSMDAAKAMAILSDSQAAPGVVCIDGLNDDREVLAIRGDSLERRYPVGTDLLKEAWRDAVLVGRLRDDSTAPNCINLWCVADNLRKGAASNAVQIAEHMLKKGLL